MSTGLRFLVPLVGLLEACSFRAAAVTGSGGRDGGPATADAPPAGDARRDSGAGGVPDAASPAPDAELPAPDAAPGSTHFHYVTSSLRVGATTGEAMALAFDLDGDFRPDDRLGVTLISVGVDIDAALADAVRSGAQVLLHSVEADDLFGDGSVVWRTFRGDPLPDPDLESGEGVFTVAADSWTDSLVPGDIAAGNFNGAGGHLAAELALAPDTPPIPIELEGARIAADVTEGGCAGGRIGGGITVAHLDTVVLPAMAVVLDARIAADDGCRERFADCTPSNQLLLSLLDGNHDRVISVEEVRDSVLVRSLLVPDVDLLDENGAPGKDGVDESVSLAVGFTCTRARFTAPGE